MQKIQKLIEKLKLRNLFDGRFAGLIVLGLIGLSVVWSGVRVVDQNYGLLRKIARLEQENKILELQNYNKSIQNEYYKTQEFAELKARRVYGRAAPGETVYILSDDTAKAALKTSEQQDFTTAEKAVEKPRYQRNFEAWMEFFFGNN